MARGCQVAGLLSYKWWRYLKTTIMVNSTICISNSAEHLFQCLRIMDENNKLVVNKSIICNTFDLSVKS